MGVSPHIWIPKRDIIPPSPPAQRRIDRQKQIDRETRTYTGRVLLPGSAEYEREVACIGAPLLFPGAAQVRREVTAGASVQGLAITAPTAFWRMEDGSDSVGSETLSNLNSVTFVGGKLSNCANFASASQQALYRASDAVLSIGAGVSFAWFGWIYFATSNNYPMLLNKGILDGSSSEYYFYYDAGGFFSAVMVHQIYPANLIFAVSLSTWYFCGFWYDQPNARIYVRANATETTAQTGPADSLGGTGEFSFGACTAGTDSNWLNGRLDAWALFRGYLPTLTERNLLYNGSGTAAGTEYYAGYWH